MIDNKRDIYQVQYTYRIDNQDCHITWCGRAASADNAVAMGIGQLNFAEEGATIIAINAQTIHLNKNCREMAMIFSSCHESA